MHPGESEYRVRFTKCVIPRFGVDKAANNGDNPQCL